MTTTTTADYYELDLRGVPDGAYDLAVVLYQPLSGGGFRDLPFGDASRAVIRRITIRNGQVEQAA